MIQDIAPHVYHNEYTPRAPQSQDVLFDFEGISLRMKKDHTFFTYDDVSHDRNFIYLFRIDDTAYYLTDLKEEEHILVTKYELRYQADNVTGFAGITGWSLYDWMIHNQYCGVCGHTMKQDEKERAMRCPECGNIVYPRINPAVIVAVINDEDQLLVTRYANGPYKRWALVAGYVEIGETLEQCVKREVKEETGLDVSDLVYYKSQPWGLSGSVLSGFWCRAHGNQNIVLQRSELAVAEWKDHEDEIELTGHAALTAEMIGMYRNGGYRRWISIR